MSYPEKITLHLGMSKTGSTSTQAFLLRNKALLEEQGILYPSQGLHGQGHAALAHLLVSNKLLKNVPDPAPVTHAKASLFSPLLHLKNYAGQRLLKLNKRKKLFSGIIQELLNECREKRIKHLIISSEGLFFLKPAIHRFLLKQFYGARLEIVIFVRRQDQWLESAMRQLSKAMQREINQDLLNYSIKRMDLNYYKRIAALDSLNPDGQVMVIPFPAAIRDLSIEKLFCELAGIQWNRDFIIGEKENVSLSRDCLAWLLQNKEQLPYGCPQFFKAVEVLQQYSCMHPDPPEYKRILSAVFWKEFLSNYIESNTALEREFLPARFDRLFEPYDAENEPPWEEYPGLTPESTNLIDAYMEKNDACLK